MRSITRMVLGSLLAVPLTVGAAGAAMADDFYEHTVVAGPNGTEAYAVHSAVGGNGDSYFLEQYTSTGPEGSFSSTTAASSGQGRYDVGGKWRPNAFYTNTTQIAGPEGAMSSTTVSSVNHHDHDEDDD